MTKVSSSDYKAAGEKLLTYVNSSKYIPYVPGGMGLDGMDCQGQCEYLLIECSVPKSECNLKGSNAHWRECLWTGTPEECVKTFGRVPAGAWVFIVDKEGGGEVARGYTDGLGDAQHMGVYLGDGRAIHASASRRCVAESVFKEKTIPNGGWNAVGLPKWVDYGITSESGSDSSEGSQQDAHNGLDEELTAGTDGASVARYATVTTPNGGPANLRKTASTNESMYWHVNPGARVEVLRDKGEWCLIRALCADGHIRKAYMMSKFLKK